MMAAVHPGDGPLIQERWDHALATGSRFDAGFRIIRPSGDVRHIRAMGQFEYDASGVALRIVGADWDVTDEVELTQALAEEQSRLKLATDAGKIGIWELRFSDGRMTWDHQLREMFGLDDEAPSSWELFQKIVHPDDLPNMPMGLDAWNPDPQLLENEFRIVRPNGEVRRIRVKSKIENDANGTPWRAVGADWDITEEYDAAEALKAAKESAEAAERAKSEFLAMVSHEIRTPMNTVLGMTRLALQTELTPKQHNYLSKINASATSLIEIISDFLDFSKMEAGKLQLEPSTFKIDSVLESVSAVLAMRAEEKGLEIIFHVEPGTPD
jgi:two-component system sensor histidine kinase/response regulator